MSEITVENFLTQVAELIDWEGNPWTPARYDAGRCGAHMRPVAE